MSNYSTKYSTGTIASNYVDGSAITFFPREKMSFFVSGPEGHDYDLRQLTEDQKSFYVNVIQPALIDGSGATTRPGIWNTFSIVRGGIEDPVEIKAIKCSMDSNDIPLDQRAPGTAILYMNGRIEGPTGPCEGSSTGSDHLFEDYL